jgi:hypothetical protein
MRATTLKIVGIGHVGSPMGGVVDSQLELPIDQLAQQQMCIDHLIHGQEVLPI